MKINKNIKGYYRLAGFISLSLLCLYCLSNCGGLPKKTIKVTSLTDLQEAIDNAKAGENIILANGTYQTSEPVRIVPQGTALMPITISAESIGGVTITGPSGFSIQSPARYVTVKGFVFKHAADSSSQIQYGADHCRFTRNVFELSGEIGSYLTVAGDHAEIDYNTFQNKSMEGRMLLVEGPGGEPMARNVWVHHNLFRNFENTGSNNSSAIQFGRSWSSLTPAYGIIEYNLFINSRGENENVAHKASNCIIRYNTFGPGSTELSLRHGNHNEVYGNFFFDTDGIRIFGDDNLIYNNYLEGNSRAIHIGNGRAEVADGAEFTTHDRPDRTEIVHNTMVDNVQNFYMGGRENGLGATRTIIANNIIQGGGPAAEIRGPHINVRWEGNLIWNTSGIDDVPPEGYRAVNPLLYKRDSIFHLQPGSPAIDAGLGSFKYIVGDIDNQERDHIRDIGSDEYSTVPIRNHPLTLKDVGPQAKR